MAAQCLPGFYGKVPSLGDFVTRDLPRAFIEPWDDWLQRAIARSREQLGERWLEVYLESPMWRFALSEKVCGPGIWAGLVMPSVDRVGRYFPLTLALPMPATTALLPTLQGASFWFERAEMVLRGVLEEEMCDPDTLGARLVALGPLPVVRMPVADGIVGSVRAAGAYHIAVGGVDGLVAAMPGMLEQLLQRQLGPYSLWWSAGSTLVNPSLLMCRGMPPAEGYVAMLDGRWLQGVWQEWALPLVPSVRSTEDPS